MSALPQLRIGQGFDVHRFADPSEGRRLMLMGCEVPHDRGLAGHSDADVMLHALMDALLGAAGLGDIGQHFPDTDAAYKGADSFALLERVMEAMRERGWRVMSADVCLIGERPKLAPHRERMRARVAPALGLDLDALNVKATTTEKLGFTGRGEGLAAQAVALIGKA
ncbi:MAG TPA: 2-C-methyl-D-erythritol 2,4-cyclodiphosphate synthase [Holophagaceae bacterium]|jgi:2-C-methyl-D-erythritol 2,4-cyclodiphosphate synthase|nr:2-C-methyl-D-erythritol 2,4-cyclodiphosphate synthase [Holophagaceae bacterium]